MKIETADALLRDLLERGLVSRSGAVDGDVIIVSKPERGWYRVLEKDRAQLFARTGGEAIARERALYAHAFDFLPALRVAEDDLLVSESFPGGYDVVEFHRMGRRIAEWLPALIGRTLAILHATQVTAAEAAAAPLPRALQPDDGQVAPPIGQAIARVASQWTGNALIHGDAGFDGIIVASESDRRIHLVGWDDVRIGDPAWDAGAVLESYYAWSLDPKIVSDVEGPVCPLPPTEMQSAIVSFWSTYAMASRLAPAEGRARLVRAFGYAGVRMMERIERMMRKPDGVSPALTQMMQAAIGLMTAPATAADLFFAPPRPMWAPQQPWGAW